MNLNDYLTVLRRRWVSALVVALAVVVASVAYSLAVPAQYTASTQLFFGLRAGSTAADLVQGSTFTENQMASYEAVAKSPLVLDKVVSSLGLSTTSDELAARVNANASLGTVVLKISVTDTNSVAAADIANAIGQQLIATVGSLAPQQSDGAEVVRATVLTPASVPLNQSSPNVLRNIALGIALGLLLGVGFALLRNFLDTKIREEQDVQAITEAPVLGSIALDKNVTEHPLIVADHPHSAAAEAVRRLRTSLQFVGDGSEGETLVVTSSLAGEGKSVLSVNLATSMADAGARVILVDANLRRPSAASLLGVEGATGLSSILAGHAELDDVVQAWGDSTLAVLPSGPIPPNPSELLGSAAMFELLARLTSSYDVVLLDTPPVLPVADATILTRMVGGAIVVAGADRLHRRQLRDSLANLEAVGAHVYGVVLNKVAKREVDSDAYPSYAPGTASQTGAPARARASSTQDVPALSASGRH
jgi:succinoglycan biosynthesis transport protein ExoP